MKTNTIKSLLAVAASALLLASTGLSQDAGTWTLSVGAHNIAPKSGKSNVVGDARAKVENDLQPTFAIGYFPYQNVEIQLLASLPYRHDLKVDGDYAAQTKLLPPTLSVLYHFVNASKFTPFVGVGVNYTYFFDTRTAGGLAGADLDAKESWGFAGNVGVDYKLTERSSIRLDARWIEAKSDIRINGTKVGALRLDPVVYGASWVYRF